MDWNELRKLVPAAGGAPDFQACLEAFPALEHAKTTMQEPRHHAEGNVWTHTMMVIEALLALPGYQGATREEQEILFFAALLHDGAKYSTTTLDPVTGAIGQPGHSRRGSIDARIALWDWGMPFAARETVCRLIDRHQQPFFAIEGSRTGHSPEFIVRELSWQVPLPLLALLAEADMRGRICADAQRALDNIELFGELAREDGCWRGPRAFADAHTALAYFRGAQVYPDFPLHREPGPRAIVMSGLPASGKNSFVERHHPCLPVVSFDDAREELGLRHGKNEGMVAHHAIDKARDLLRQGRDLVFNATHLSRSMRRRTVDLLLAYGAEVEIVYLEQPRAELLRRNTRRDSSLTNKSLEAMLVRWEVPLPTEAHAVQYEPDLSFKKPMQAK